MSKKLLITGGSTAGHIVPYIPLIKDLSNSGWEIHCLCLNNELERRLLGKLNITFHKIESGKLRRYLSFENVKDLFKAIRGFKRAYWLVKQIQPNIVFSKGGHVAPPVALAAWLNKVPFIIHESDTIPSLTTKLSYYFSDLVCTGFDVEDGENWNVAGRKIKHKYTGIPIREEFINLAILRKKRDKLNLLVIGGSLGSNNINVAVRDNLQPLLNHFNIVHICGLGKIDQSLKSLKNYQQEEFIVEGIATLINNADIVVSRGGATFLYECLYLGKPVLVIPLSRIVSRGDQVSNAVFIKSKDYGDYILEEDLINNPDLLLKKLASIKNNRVKYENSISNALLINAKEKIIELINSLAK